MIMQLTAQYNYPQRNQNLENEIDIILATELLTVQSIRVYLDALQNLLEKYHEKPAPHTLRNLSNYIFRSNINLSHNYPYNYLSSKHQKHIIETAEYIKNLKISLKNGSANPWGALDQIIYNIEHLIRHHKATNAEIKSHILEKFTFHPDADCIDLGLNLEIRLFYPEAIIHVVRSWENFNLPTSRHMVSLIVCLDDVSSAPEEIFSTGRLRTLSSLNHVDQFEQIGLRNPIQGCIDMTELSIHSLKWKHSNFENLITNLEQLLNELKQISIQTHKYLEPKGHLILEATKHCLSLVQPLLNTASKLPDSDVIRMITYRLERTAFSLSALFSNLSIRLNTKKYIITALNNILSNDGLYKHKQKPRILEHAFSEENLNTILAGNLACFYHHQKSIDILTEVPMGAGFADIVVKFGKAISAIVEGKLVKKLSEAQGKVLEGLSQLYNRYGNHHSILDTFGVELYLIVFAYDQDHNKLSKATLEAVEEFSENHKIDLQTHMEGRDHLHFSFVDNRYGTGLPPKRRSIYIFYCNMEVVKKNEPDYRVIRNP